jgi:hypothetical protein
VGIIVGVGLFELISGEAVMACDGSVCEVGTGLDEALSAGDDENDDSVGWRVSRGFFVGVGLGDTGILVGNGLADELSDGYAVIDDGDGLLVSIILVGIGLLEMESGDTVTVCDGLVYVVGAGLNEALSAGYDVNDCFDGWFVDVGILEIVCGDPDRDVGTGLADEVSVGNDINGVGVGRLESSCLRVGAGLRELLSGVTVMVGDLVFVAAAKFDGVCVPLLGRSVTEVTTAGFGSHVVNIDGRFTGCRLLGAIVAAGDWNEGIENFVGALPFPIVGKGNKGIGNLTGATAGRWGVTEVGLGRISLTTIPQSIHDFGCCGDWELVVNAVQSNWISMAPSLTNIVFNDTRRAYVESSCPLPRSLTIVEL